MKTKKYRTQISHCCKYVEWQKNWYDWNGNQIILYAYIQTNTRYTNSLLLIVPLIFCTLSTSVNSNLSMPFEQIKMKMQKKEEEKSGHDDQMDDYEIISYM